MGEPFIEIPIFKKTKEGLKPVRGRSQEGINEATVEITHDEKSSEYKNFSDTILHVFKTIIKEYHSPYIELTAKDLLSFCNGMSYYKKFEGVREIVFSPYYLEKTQKVLEKYCTQNKNSTFQYPTKSQV